MSKFLIEPRRVSFTAVRFRTNRFASQPVVVGMSAQLRHVWTPHQRKFCGKISRIPPVILAISESETCCSSIPSQCCKTGLTIVQSAHNHCLDLCVRLVRGRYWPRASCLNRRVSCGTTPDGYTAGVGMGAILGLQMPIHSRQVLKKRTRQTIELTITSCHLSGC